MPEQNVSNTFRIEIAGQPLPADVEATTLVVEDNVHLPDSFVLRFRDAHREVLGSVKAALGSKVRISVLADSAPAPVVLLNGEITALEAEIGPHGSFTVVRGYDESHRLFRGRVTETYRNLTYSEIAKKVAGRHGLSEGTIESTHPAQVHVAQANCTDWAFLRRLAGEVGYEVSVRDGKLSFKAPEKASAGPGAVDLQVNGDDLNLLVGSSLLYLRGSITAAEQVGEVEVRAWDPHKKQAFVSRCAARSAAIDNGVTPGDVVKIFPGPAMVAAHTPLGSAKEVATAAATLSEQVAGVGAELEGAARGNPKLRAGAAIRLGLAGKPFDGRYVLTTTRHSWDPEDGYVTNFTVTGNQERSLHAMTSAGGSGREGRVDGLVSALIDDVDDPTKQGRVRLRFPWMADHYVSDWSRVATPGAGKDRGLAMSSEVGDEVVVGFELGDVSRPVVLGGLHNDLDPPAQGPDPYLDASTKAVNNRSMTSRTGHHLTMVDAPRALGVTLSTGDGGFVIHLDQTGRTLSIAGKGAIEINADTTLTMKAAGISLQASGQLELRGAQVSVDSSGPAKVTGHPIQLN